MLDLNSSTLKKYYILKPSQEYYSSSGKITNTNEVYTSSKKHVVLTMQKTDHM